MDEIKMDVLFRSLIAAYYKAKDDLVEMIGNELYDRNTAIANFTYHKVTLQNIKSKMEELKQEGFMSKEMQRCYEMLVNAIGSEAEIEILKVEKDLRRRTVRISRKELEEMFG